VFFYSNERGEPPHVHVRAEGKEAKFWLRDVTLAVNIGFRPHELRSIIRKLRQERENLLAAWHDHLGN
jgi:hypothetical protein